jgi:NleD-like pathogen effector protein (putative zinc metallopeptidase)
MGEHQPVAAEQQKVHAPRPMPGAAGPGVAGAAREVAALVAGQAVSSAPALSPHTLLMLQRTAGNRAVNQLLRRMAGNQSMVGVGSTPARGFRQLVPLEAEGQEDRTDEASVARDLGSPPTVAGMDNHLPTLRLNAPHGGHGATIVQRLMTLAQFQESTAPRAHRSRLYSTVDPLLHEYERLADNPAPGAQRRRMEVLYSIEHAAYAWCIRKPRGGKYSHGYSAVQNLLDDVQREHQARVAQMAASGGRLDVGVQGLSDQDDQTIQTVWQSIRGNAGIIEITEMTTAAYGVASEQKAGFRDAMLALFARLLTSATGRKLLQELLAGPQRPGARGPREQDRITVRPLGPSDEHAGRTIGAAGVKMIGPEQPKRTGPGQDLYTHGAWEFGEGEQPDALRGEGIGSFVTYTHLLTDSNPEVTLQNGDPLLTPVFIGFGHELVHALHNLRGTNLNKAPMSDADKGIWSNPEERQTIEPRGEGVISENQLRQEHGLPLRHGHGSHEP